MGFELDERAFKSAMNNAVNNGVSRLAGELPWAVDDVHAQYRGKPIEEIKSALQLRFAQIEGTNPLADPELSRYAEAVAEGRRLRIDYQPI
ncbi:MAG: hypothetical protein QOG20_4656 [Pseudonocardiales bacterium]|jgi:hypothetical protein|nr:hypothetical protein [Pseudonocardiales bacterium]